MADMTTREREIFEQAQMNHHLDAHPGFYTRCDEPAVIRALVICVAASLKPLSNKFEVKNGRFVLEREDQGDYTPKLLKECEYTWEQQPMFCSGRLLHYVQGTIYVVEQGMFIVVAGYPRSFESEDSDLIRELFYLGS